MGGRKRQSREKEAKLPPAPVSVLFSLQRGEEQVEVSRIEDLIEDAIVSTQPAMMVNLRACSAPVRLVSRH